MHNIVYVSSATQPFDERQLAALLEKAQRKNQALGITGALVYRDGNFIQMLEGEKHIILKMFQEICRDPRHTDVTLLNEGVTPDRHFPGTAMCRPELRRTPALSAERVLSDPSGSLRMIRKFVEFMR